MNKVILAIAATLALAGCTDAKFDKMTNFGGAARVVCYSGGKVIYDGKSTGKVISEQYSDGYAFRDSQTGNLKEVSGDCDITYD